MAMLKWIGISVASVYVAVKAAYIHRRLYRAKAKLVEGCALFRELLGAKGGGDDD